MFTPQQLENMEDRDIGIYASGGYGQAKRRAFLMSLRDATRKARLYDAKHPEPESKASA